MPKFIDLTGKKFERLKVIKRVDNDNSGRSVWLCKCDCGKKVSVRGSDLVSGKQRSCSCLMREISRKRGGKRKDYINLTGRKFGRLLVIKNKETKVLNKNGKYESRVWICLCDCGRKVTVRGIHLRSGHSKSCGCLLSEKRYIKKGRLDSDWKSYTKQGYILLYKPSHFNSYMNGTIPEHVYVMSNFLGRNLSKDEVIHHKNGIRDDNRIENLELCVRRTHIIGQRVSDIKIFCVEFLSKYAPELLK